MNPGAEAAGKNFESVANFSPLFRFLSAVFFWIYAPLVIIYNHVVFGIRIEGRQHLRRGGSTPCILVSNHSLYLDPAFIIHTLFPRRAYYMALKSHFRHPVGGMLLRLMGGVPIPGASGMKAAETTTRTALARGHCVHMFPEGVLTHLNQDLKPFIRGAFYLAVRIGVPVIPLTLVHYPRRWFGREISPYFRRVKCVVGEPVETVKLDRESDRQAAARLAVELRRRMMETITFEQRRRAA